MNRRTYFIHIVSVTHLGPRAGGKVDVSLVECRGIIFLPGWHLNETTESGQCPDDAESPREIENY